MEPLRTNLKTAFKPNKNGIGQQEPNYEWRSRGADYTVSRVNIEDFNFSAGFTADDKDFVHDDWVSTQGYAVNRSNPEGKSTLTDKIYDSQVYSITSPGFHAISMDDRMENCRIRLRTTAGHQILMDDTNERIYIQTAQGNNWIELDQDGNIDVFTTNKVNIRARKDINLTSEETIRLTGKKGIHMYTEDEVRMHAKKDIHVRTEQNLRTHALENVYLQADQSIHYTAGETFYLKAVQEINERCGSDMKLSSGGTMHKSAGVHIRETAERIDMNGPPASEATEATRPDEQPAFWTSRLPDHEPWARVMTKDDFTDQPEFQYKDKQVNRSERGRTINRGIFWRR